MPSLPKPLRGVIPPMVTPLSKPDTLDERGVEKLVEHILEGGVHGLFVLGTTGEAPGLAHPVRHALVRQVCAQVSGRVPVLVGITDTSMTETFHLATTAAEAGATALVAAPPFYFPNGQPELVEYFEHLAPALPLPLFLYNMPTHTKTFLEVGTVRRLMAQETIAGIKDSSGDMSYFHELLRLRAERPGWAVLAGPETLLAESVLLGGDGGVCGGANLDPQLFVRLFEAADCGNLPTVRELHARVMEMACTLYRIGRHGSSFIKSVKCSLSELGICNDFMSEPMHRFREPERALVRETLARLGLLS